MTRRQVWRYQCDHCKKSNCSASSIARHEKGCFRNPARYCDLCEVQWPRPELIAVASETHELKRVYLTGDPYEFSSLPAPDAVAIVERLDTEADTCPCCILSAIIQAKVKDILPFDFKKARDDWDEENRRCSQDLYDASMDAYSRVLFGEVI